jgi:LysM repeat protein
MSLFPFKLEKLKIKSFKTAKRDDLLPPTFTVMFNPSSLSMKHENVFQKYQGLNTTGREAKYIHTKSEVIALEITIDGTGVTAYPLLPKKPQSVSTQINDLLKLCFDMDSGTHEPRYLKIQWGTGILSDFDCRMKSVDIKYTQFDRSGAPLRATLSAVFVEDVDPTKQNMAARKSSPDLTHVHVVRSGDTLPLLCRNIYGSSEYYLRVAQFNNLDDFRNLTPGQTLHFPPLADTQG